MDLSVGVRLPPLAPREILMKVTIKEEPAWRRVLDIEVPADVVSRASWTGGGGVPPPHGVAGVPEGPRALGSRPQADGWRSGERGPAPGDSRRPSRRGERPLAEAGRDPTLRTCAMRPGNPCPSPPPSSGASGRVLWLSGTQAEQGRREIKDEDLNTILVRRDTRGSRGRRPSGPGGVMWSRFGTTKSRGYAPAGESHESP